MLNPKTRGPSTAVSLGNDLRTLRMSKLRPRDSGSDITFGASGNGQLGCFDCKSFHVWSLLGAMPSERRTLLAFLIRPSLARDTAESIV